MRIRFRLLFLLLVVNLLLFAQNPELMLQKSFSGGGDNFGRSISADKNGDYVIAGDLYLESDTVNYLVANVDVNNQLKWQKTYGGSGHETPNEVIHTTDGGILLIGYSNSSDGDVHENKGWDDCWLLKLDASGTIQWERSFGGSSRDLGENIIESVDDGYYVAATTKSIDGDVSTNKGGSDFWLVKINAEGNIAWERTYGGSEDEIFSDFKQLNDSCLLLLGSSRSADGDVENNYGGKDYWLIKTDINGNLLWERNYGGSNSDNGASIALKENGGFVLGGSSKSSDVDVTKNIGLDDYWIVSCNASGDIEWQRSYGGSKNDVLKKIASMEDGYLLVGYSFSYDFNVTDNHGSSDMWVAKTFTNGQLKWTRSLGGSEADLANDMAFSSDFGYLIAGYTASSNGDVEESSGNIDMWVVKLCETYNIQQYFAICTGDSLFWEGVYYKENSSEQKSFTSQCGKDSLRSMQLIVMDYPDNFSIAGDTVVLALRSAIYTVPKDDALTYSFEAIHGEILESISNNQIRVQWDVPGTGTVKAIAKNVADCTSDTAYLSVRITGLSIDENATQQVKIYPNPFKDGLLNIEGERIKMLEIFDTFGSTIYAETYAPNTSQASIHLENQERGIYFILIQSADNYLVRKLIVY